MSLDVDSTAWLLVVTLHSASTWFLVGLIWLIHVVHYPSFASIASDRYVEFQERHMQRMGQLIALPWLIEGLTVLAVFAFAPTTAIRLLATLGGLLELVVIASTIRSAVPAHAELTSGYNTESHARLLASNRTRTLAWTVRGAIATTIVFLTMRELIAG